MTYALTFIGVALTLFLADVCWALYFIKIEERKSLMAGVFGSLIYMFGAFAVTQYTEDKSFIIAATIGAFAGTYVTVEWKRKKDQKEKQTT